MKVFLNDRLILFTDHFPSEVKPEEHCIVCSSPAQIKSSYRQFGSDPSIPYLFIRYSTPGEQETMLKKFISLFSVVEAAGGVVKNDYGEILFIHRLGYWDLPKGKISKRDRKMGDGRTGGQADQRTGGPETEIPHPPSLIPYPAYARIAAIREVQEETGLVRLTVTEELATTWHIYSRAGIWYLKRTYWYGMTADVLQTLTPQTEEDIAEVRWISPSEFDGIREKCYASLRELF